MTTRAIDDECLKKLCAPLPPRRKPLEALQRILAFGELGRWWLDPSVLELAAGAAKSTSLAAWFKPPALVSEIGSTWVLFVNTRPGDSPLLRRAMLLPLRWQRDCDHSTHLPVHLE